MYYLRISDIMTTEQRKEQMRKYRQKPEVKEQRVKYLRDHKERIREHVRIYHQNHKEQIKEWNRKYLQEHREHKREYNNNWRKEHPEHQKNWIQKLKMKAFEKLGNKCSNPFNLPHLDWCNDVRVLQIDHVHGHGTKERKEIGNQFYLYKKILADTEGNYQILCANCNWLKRREKKEHGT